LSDLSATRVAVVGAGAFGLNHLRVWQDLERSGAPVRVCAVVDPSPGVAQAVQQHAPLPVYFSVADLLAHGGCDAASVAVPTSQHFAVASQLLAAGTDVLLEKPITATLEEADALLALARKNQRILQPGHLERFNPAVLAMRPVAVQPLFFEVHRLSVFTPRSLDVDVVLDLMIHDLDVVLSLVKSPVAQLHAVGLPVLSGKVDIANVRLEFVNGCVANFTASRVSTERVRKLRFFAPHRYVSLDYARQDVLLIDVAGAGSPAAEEAAVRFTAAESRHPTPEFSMRKLEVTPGEPLRLELEAFLHAVRTRTAPAVTGEDGRAALKLALEILAAIRAHHARSGIASR
jgi:predicted dehydrogenase